MRYQKKTQPGQLLAFMKREVKTYRLNHPQFLIKNRFLKCLRENKNDFTLPRQKKKTISKATDEAEEIKISLNMWNH